MKEGLSLETDDFRIKKPLPKVLRDARKWLEKKAPEAAGFLQVREDDVEASEHFTRHNTGMTHCLWIGIGGSSLGPKSFLEALSFRRIHPPISVSFLENPDPTDFRLTLGRLDPKKTLVCIVTKSGQTFETWALAFAALQWLGKNRWKTQVLALTDPETGPLRQLVQREGLQSLPIEPQVGGRFSIFSPVGYLPMLMEGFSAREFVRGALQARDRWTSKKDFLTPLAYTLAKKSRTHPLTLVFPYSSRLREWGSWFTQLWAESLGKKGSELLPVAALGAVDQHSLLQRFQEGANDFVSFFIRLHRHPMTVSIPAGPELHTPALAGLHDRTLEELLEIELQATRGALQAAGRPTGLWTLRALEESPLGELYYSWCLLTALTGYFLKVNPFDQPGVEDTKKAIRLTLSKPRG